MVGWIPVLEDEMKMNHIQLQKILDDHSRWLETRHTDNVKGCRANFEDIVLDSVSFAGVNLTDAIFKNVTASNVDFQHANLSGTDFSYASFMGIHFAYTKLKNANFEGANLHRANFKDANLFGANFTFANLMSVNFKSATLSHADFKGADIDFSCLPLWCGSLNVHFDDRQLKQIAYHLVRAGLQSKNASKETKSELNKLVDFANGFHRVGECGLIEDV